MSARLAMGCVTSLADFEDRQPFPVPLTVPLASEAPSRGSRSTVQRCALALLRGVGCRGR